MKKNTIKSFLIIAAMTTLLASCTSTSKIMREPNMRVNLEMDDFTLSDQVSAEASSTKIVGIDWDRLFLSETGAVQSDKTLPISFASVPVIGEVVADQTTNYALFTLMQENPGYDVVYYPQIEKTVIRPLGVGVIYRKTHVKVTARLGKLKK